MNASLDQIRDATRNTRFENNLYLVGGFIRDRLLGHDHNDDVDIVLEEDAVALSHLLFEKGLSSHFPVTYPRFGTAMVTIGGVQVELVTARAEQYDPTHRKPEVVRASLTDDAFRRDFTINTLMENLHTGEQLDITGFGRADLELGIIRTPKEPAQTFFDDPLRMLRAIRFASRFGFEIDHGTSDSILKEAHRLNLMVDKPVVSAERIRDEFVKVMIGPDPVKGLRLLLEYGLLVQFAPELAAMDGVTQNNWHLYDVWEHTMRAIEALVVANSNASLADRLSMLFHDIGKVPTRTVDEAGNIHFYQHQFESARMSREIMNRLKFANDEIHEVTSVVEHHMRLGEYKPAWGDAAVRRLIRSIYPHKDALFRITAADMAAMRQDVPKGDMEALRARMEEIDAQGIVALFDSPLDGLEVMETLGVTPGPILKEAKDFLVNEVLDGRLEATDKEKAKEIIRTWFKSK